MVIPSTVPTLDNCLFFTVFCGHESQHCCCLSNLAKVGHRDFTKGRSPPIGGLKTNQESQQGVSLNEHTSVKHTNNI